jgi:hypothetical protein
MTPDMTEVRELRQMLQGAITDREVEREKVRELRLQLATRERELEDVTHHRNRLLETRSRARLSRPIDRIPRSCR